MNVNRRGNGIGLAALILVWVAPAAAVTDTDKCAADKLKRAGQYHLCRMKAEGKGIKKGDAPDFTKCDAKLADKFAAAETKYGAACPTTGDVADIQAQLTADSNSVAAKLGSGTRFVDNGDGTVTDLETGLMWEQKDDAGGIHDKDDQYTWSASGTLPDGTVFTTFLGTLNNGTKDFGTGIGGCFAGYCDWRLPTIEELQTILLDPFPCASAIPCIDPIFGPTQADFYWSNTTLTGSPLSVWFVNFINGDVNLYGKTLSSYARAVRGGW